MSERRLSPRPIDEVRTISDVESQMLFFHGSTEPAAGLTHVVAVWEPTATAPERTVPESPLGVIAIGPEAPKSSADFFILQLTRAMADAIVVTGKILRDEPGLTYDLVGPEADALHDYRRSVLDKPAPPRLVVLTSGNIDPSHPALSSWARAEVATTEAGAERLGDSGLQVRAMASPSLASLVEALREDGAANISLEAGPSTVRPLYEANPPVALDGLFLSAFRGPSLATEARGRLSCAGRPSSAVSIGLGKEPRWRRRAAPGAFPGGRVAEHHSPRPASTSAMPLAPGSHFLLPTVYLHVFEGPEPGPTALIQAGIHGDEIAGVHALEELLEAGIVPQRGRLLVMPRMNPAAYRGRQRSAREDAPGWAGLDLNRCFPGDADSPELERRLARKLMSLVEDERPALVATLHESQKRYDPNVTPSFGQSLVYGVDPIPGLVDRVVERLNGALADEKERWATQYYPVATSSTEVIVDAIDCVGVCVETWMGFDERRRIDMQKDVVRLMLDEAGVRDYDAPL